MCVTRLAEIIIEYTGYPKYNRGVFHCACLPLSSVIWGSHVSIDCFHVTSSKSNFYIICSRKLLLIFLEFHKLSLTQKSGQI